MKKQMNEELVAALRAAGVEIEPVTKKAELTLEQKVERIAELLVKKAELQAVKDTAGLKKVRRQLRSLDFYSSLYKKASE